MFYHSNKLNVHYLHDIGSPSLQITPQEEGEKRKVIITWIISKLHFVGSITQRDCFTLKRQHSPGWSVEEHQDRGDLAHMLRSGRGADPSKRKCHKTKDDGTEIPVFRPNSLSQG